MEKNKIFKTGIKSKKTPKTEQVILDETLPLEG